MTGMGGAASSARAGLPGAGHGRLRTTVEHADAARVAALVERTGFFSVAETAIARELVEERLARGPASGYCFVFADCGPGLAGYACYGPVPATRGSWDLYWIAVDPAAQRRGLGHEMLAAVEDAVATGGGERLYVDTSSRLQYEPTRLFYRGTGFRLAAELPDFYGPGDGRLIYEKTVAPARRDA